MRADQFETRLAIVRHRFATTLESKITDAVVSADHMAHSGDGVINQVSTSYRHLHGIRGIGPTVGFPATGEAARAAEVTLMQAYRERREPTQTEVMSLKKALERLRVAAASELRLMYQRGDRSRFKVSWRRHPQAPDAPCRRPADDSQNQCETS